MPDELPEGMVPYREYLYRLGDLLDCYATIEFQGTTEGMLQRGIVTDEDVETIDDLVDKLSTELDGVTVIRSTANPSVIHLIETALIQTGYVMDQEATVTYQGLLRDLPAALGENVNGIGPMRGHSGWETYEDHFTETTVDVTDEMVRDVLVNAVPLQNYDRILFEASTFIWNQEPYTQVRFLGPMLTE